MENMNQRPVVSIIVPVYNMKDYLDKAFDSICSQTLTDWELFLVDDGSTDGSSTICDIMASDDSRIHVIHQENQGAAAARNVAIEQARGKYLYFMDADDWAVPEMLYDMVCLAENYMLDAWAGVPVNNAGRRLSSIGRRLMNPSEMKADVPEEQCAQMVVTGFYIETFYSEEEYYLQKQAVRPRVFADKYAFREYAHVLFDSNLLYTPWNKLYLASYIKEHHITFPAVHWDDFPFNLEVIREIERVTVTDHAYYHFIRKRSDSESEKYNAGLFDKREEENQWLLDLYQTWKGEYQAFLVEEMKRDPSLISMFQEPDEQIDVKPSKEPVAAGAEHTVDPWNVPEKAQNRMPEEAGKESKDDETPAGGTTSDGADHAEGESDTGEKTGEETKTGEAGPDGTSGAEGENGEAETDSSEDPGKKELPSIPVPHVLVPSPAASEFIARRYLERIIGCIENVTNDACELSKKEKRKEIKEMIHKESVRDALQTAKPRSSYMKVMLLPVRMKSTTLTYIEGSIISRVKKKHVKLFAKLKAGR